MKKFFIGFLTFFMATAVVLSVVPPKKAEATILGIILAHEKAKEEGKKSPLALPDETEKNSLPVKVKEGLPTSQDLVKDGKVVQRRYYDQKGRAEVDIDYDHSNGDGTHTFPHRHNWSWPEVGPPSRGPGY